MSQVNYVMILLQGFCNDRTGHLADYYYREIKKLQNDGYSLEEISGNFQLILTEFQRVIERPFHEQLNLWYQYETQQKREGKPLAMEKPTKETFSGTVNLFHQTGGRFKGYIDDSDLQKIKQKLEFAYQKIQYEKLRESIADLQGLIEKKANKNNPPNTTNNPNGWTALTFLLCKYFENHCKIPTDSQVEAMETPGIKKGRLKNKHRELIDQEYNHTGNKLSIRTFHASYTQLIIHFNNSNLKAYKEVVKRNEVLKETYPTILN